MTVFNWSQTAATNASADATINWSENQAPSSVNDSARAMMAALAKWRDDLSGATNTGGISTAYTVTSNQGYTSLSDGISVVARVHTTSGAAPTLNVDSLGAKDIYIYSSTAVPTGGLLGGAIYRFTYDSGDDVWYVHNYQAIPDDEIESGSVMLFVQTSAPTGWTKSTTHNNKSLRIVSGSASSGGSVAFTTAFASQSVVGTVGNTTLTIAQMPLHGHPYNYSVGSTPTGDGGMILRDLNNFTAPAFSGTVSNSLGEQIGGTGGGQSHTHSFSGTAINLAVQYVDCIIATRD